MLVDVWDGGQGYEEEPIIYHGWTMTSKILFKDVINDAIKQYAFFASEYPVVLSIENHCSIEYQDKMANHLETILGDMLYKEPVDESLTALPSPEELKKKVLIKAKKLPPGNSSVYNFCQYINNYWQYHFHKLCKIKIIISPIQNLIRFPRRTR